MRLKISRGQAMVASVVAVGLLVLGTVWSGRLDATTQAGVTAVTASRLLDPRTGQFTGPVAVLVRGSRIVDVIPATSFNRSMAERVVDLGTLTLMPGLIDAHVHLAIGGPVRANALADLKAGFTTVADLGAASFRLLRIRDSINAGLIPGPRVLAAGLWVGTKNGICEFGGIGIGGGAEAFRQRVRQNDSAGADLVKVCVSGWPADAWARPAAYEMTDSVLRAVVDEAHRRRRLVIAHDISLGGVRAALSAGVDGLAHAAYLDAATARAVAARQMFMIPTLASLTGRDSSAGSAALLEATRLAHAAGVTIVFGTDGGVLPHGENATEFAALRSIGMTPIDAIRAATINAARALRIADSVGFVAAGMSADIIAVDGDPTADLDILRRVRFVMGRGRIVR